MEDGEKYLLIFQNRPIDQTTILLSSEIMVLAILTMVGQTLDSIHWKMMLVSQVSTLFMTLPGESDSCLIAIEDPETVIL
jgi:hypothetical protein